ncbi:SDR family NAD(P)-dependent oxidoreductase [Flavobacterium sp.]|uniref:SDR family NAD(P)-dependent oxidoreductase n=1 Tax=Flavobacterium sp. TaxID=239 RepID=UPI003BC30158
MKQLEEKVVIVTGAAGSIGKTAVKLFLEEGAKIMLVDIDEAQLIEIVNEYSNKNLRYCVADVSKAKDVEFYVNETVRIFGQIDVFFNNAGIEGVVKPIVDYPEEVFDEVISVNVKGIWLGNKYVLPNMNEGGSIIITSSVAGLIGFANLSAYVTSKHALVGIMRSTAIEAAPLKIRVNTVHPSPVNNRMMRSIEEGYSSNDEDDIKSLFEKAIPLKRYAEPIEIAKLVLFLASDSSQYITGTTLVIDGGMCAI